MAEGPGRFTAVDLVEAFYLAHAVTALDDVGVLDALAAGTSVEDACTDLDQATVRTLLELLAERTDLVERTSGGFRPTSCFDAHARIVLGQHVGAYGANAAALPVLLRDPDSAPTLVDRERHAAAYSRAPSFIVDLVADTIVRLGLGNVLDLGCGPGWLLTNLARRTAGRLWGMDSNPAMCRLAERRAAEVGASDRITVIDGDVRDIQSAAGPWRSEVETITAISVANGFFASGREDAVDWLRALRATFPGRVLLIADYYGQVGRRTPPWHRILELQDIAQVLSGQGIPPGDHREWDEIYRAAGCLPVHRIEDSEPTFFVQIVRL